MADGAGMQGFLLKKSGGKAFDKKSRVMDRWHKRWFVLPPGGTMLSYWKVEADHQQGKEALGSLDCSGATIFLKEVKNGQYRFTVESQARALKMRATTGADYDTWMAALQPIAAQVKEDEEPLDVTDADGGGLSGRMRGVTVADGDDSDDEGPGNPFGASALPMVDEGAASTDPAPPPNPFGGASAALPVACNGRGHTESVVGQMAAGMRGLLEKKSGGKADKAKWKMMEKWSKRWCARHGDAHADCAADCTHALHARPSHSPCTHLLSPPALAHHVRLGL